MWLHYMIRASIRPTDAALQTTPSRLSAILEVEDLVERVIAYRHTAVDLTGLFASTSGASWEISPSKWREAGRTIESQPSMWFPVVLAHFEKCAFEDHGLSRV